jgi:hypothetical protein
VLQIDTAKLERFVVKFLLYDDHMGLWEPLWWLNTWYPDAPPSQRQAAAAKVVRDLHATGTIELYRTREGGADYDAPALTGDEAEAEIGAAWWHAIPPHPGTVWIRATAAAADIANPS